MISAFFFETQTEGRDSPPNYITRKSLPWRAGVASSITSKEVSTPVVKTANKINLQAFMPYNKIIADPGDYSPAARQLISKNLTISSIPQSP